MFDLKMIKVESSTIADYLDDKYPDPPLAKGFDESASVDAQNATKDIFPAMAKLVKCEEPDHYAEKALLKVIEDFQKFWEGKTEGA